MKTEFLICRQIRNESAQRVLHVSLVANLNQVGSKALVDVHSGARLVTFYKGIDARRVAGGQNALVVIQGE